MVCVLSECKFNKFVFDGDFIGVFVSVFGSGLEEFFYLGWWFGFCWVYEVGGKF